MYKTFRIMVSGLLKTFEKKEYIFKCAFKKISNIQQEFYSLGDDSNCFLYPGVVAKQRQHEASHI